MKSEGGEEAAVNPLALLCLTDSIVLFCFSGSGGFTSAMPPQRKVEAMKSMSPGHTQIREGEQATRQGNQCGLCGRVCMCCWEHFGWYVFRSVIHNGDLALCGLIPGPRT